MLVIRLKSKPETETETETETKYSMKERNFKEDLSYEQRKRRNNSSLEIIAKDESLTTNR